MTSTILSPNSSALDLLSSNSTSQLSLSVSQFSQSSATQHNTIAISSTYSPQLVSSTSTLQEAHSTPLPSSSYSSLQKAVSSNEVLPSSNLQDLSSTPQLLLSTSKLPDSSSTLQPSPSPLSTATTPLSECSLTMSLWSNSSIWSNNSLESENVTIPCYLHVKVDISLLKLEILIIKGIMEFEDSGIPEYVLQATTILIDGGKLVAGTKEKPLNSKLRIILYGNRMTPLLLDQSLEINIGPKSIGVWGELILHSAMQNPKSWTMLSQTALALSNEIMLTEPVDWGVGDEIVITSTTFDAYQTETFTIANITNNQVLTLSAPLNHTHLGIEEEIGSVSYSIQAEVGRLTRKIVIENGDPDSAIDDKFGCRVFVSSIGNRSNTVQLHGVEFKGCGQQISQSNQNDLRCAALAFINASFQVSSYVSQCSFHHAYNTAVGLIGTDNVELVGNVIHDTLGPSMQVAGTGHSIVGNLASLSNIVRTNQDDLWTANFEIVSAEAINFTYNHAAGGAGIGIHTSGENCAGPSSVIRHNVAHSSLHCFHVGYSDGTKTQCSTHFNVTAYACHHYGFFSYSSSSVRLLESTFVNDKVAVYATVIGPPALSHRVGMKAVQIENVRIVSASKNFNCLQDEVVPKISQSLSSGFQGLLSPTGGHVGIVHPTFVSTPGGFPESSWSSIQGYPAISGITNINQVSFTNFGLRCRNYKDVVIMTNKYSEDANHPVYFRDITFESDGRFTLGDNGIYQKYKVFVHQPNLDSVNPADCVDMDCDGMKSVILTDLDGTFTETGSFHTIISKAEFEWDGDPRRHLGDNRIPLSLLMWPNGSITAPEKRYQQKGVVRECKFGSAKDCSFNSEWNMYLCSKLQHLLLVIESLDDDTEVRRLSPVGISANGFINLINGPKDHGWCGGYTCQERISTFYAIVASSLIYTIGFNSTTPQKMVLHLLNANSSQSIVTQTVYTYLQRFDVYINESGKDVYYVPPEDANMTADGNLAYHYAPTNPDELLDKRHGANYFNRLIKKLLIHVKGNQAYKIIAAPVLYVSVTITTTSGDSEKYFIDKFIQLLNIQIMQIRIVRRESAPTESKRRKREIMSSIETLEIEIGDPPPLTLTEDGSNSVNISMLTDTERNAFGSSDTANNTNQPTITNGTDFNSITNNVTARGVSLNYERLVELSEVVTEMIQTKQLLQDSTDTTLMAAMIVEPPVPSVDPTGGIRATQTTGGPQPGDNGTDSLLTFSQQQWLSEIENTTVLSYNLLIPSQLDLTNSFSSPIMEGVPLSGSVAPEFAIYDENKMITETLGIRNPWKLTATVTDGPKHGFISNNVVKFIKGRASFQGLLFSHPGTYHLAFNVTAPMNVNLSKSLEVSVQKRHLSLILNQQPQNGNTTFPLYPYPSIWLTENIDQHITDHSWRNTTWHITAKLDHNNQEWSAQLNNGVAIFRNIKISTPGTYQLTFKAVTTHSPSSSSLLPEDVKSMYFNITKLQFTRFIITYGDTPRTDVKGKEAELVALFLQKFTSLYSNVENFNTSILMESEGVVISTFVTAETVEGLTNTVNLLGMEGITTLTLQFQNQTLIPSTIILDPNYPVAGRLHQNNYLVPILSSTIPIIMIFLFSAILIGALLFCRSKNVKSNLQVRNFCFIMSADFISFFLIVNLQKNSTMKSTSQLNEVQSPTSEILDSDHVADFYLTNLNKDENVHLALNPGSKKELEVTSHMVELMEVSGALIANPCAEDGAA